MIFGDYKIFLEEGEYLMVRNPPSLKVVSELKRFTHDPAVLEVLSKAAKMAKGEEGHGYVVLTRQGILPTSGPLRLKVLQTNWEEEYTRVEWLSLPDSVAEVLRSCF